ncbi:hypothetical protein LX32DRAFT_456710 [Colletotrichum zoysiae]|uniref:Uncharacterized protein n=1 Tax=Colletotrichum zoysiae TaxID=1216348 RepID=A0AAD9HFQ8_9PEZI|nr:hypothetical protein LX32DRAFT_456710 [Colletotrichum zoysiae]
MCAPSHPPGGDDELNPSVHIQALCFTRRAPELADEGGGGEKHLLETLLNGCVVERVTRWLRVRESTNRWGFPRHGLAIIIVIIIILSILFPLFPFPPSGSRALDRHLRQSLPGSGRVIRRRDTRGGPMSSSRVAVYLIRPCQLSKLKPRIGFDRQAESRCVADGGPPGGRLCCVCLPTSTSSRQYVVLSLSEPISGSLQPTMNPA